MSIFNLFTLMGGLALFLYGMNLMGESLEQQAGGKLQVILSKLSDNPLKGFLLGLGVTAVIQSSSATTVMVVGFVNSGLMTLKQSIYVIMGANVGTTVTAWILSLAGIDSGNLWVQLLKPSSFTPILALIGIVKVLFSKEDKKKDTGTILLGFAVLMYGMDAMSASVSVLRDVPGFRELFLAFTNPVLGVLAGAALTAIIQSSSASVGILQALASTGQVTYGAAIPIIMGQNIGTCVTALLSSVGTNKNARRAALVHLSFNILGTVLWLAVFSAVRALFHPLILGEPATLLGIAVCHSVFNVLCTVILFPLGSTLEALVCHLVPEDKLPEKTAELDERLLVTPALALDRCRVLIGQMAGTALEALEESVESLDSCTPELGQSIRTKEGETDHYEDILGTYLVKLSACKISREDSMLAAGFLKVIGDFERIADHSVNILEAGAELRQKKLRFSDDARKELKVLTDAVSEIAELANDAFLKNDPDAAARVEPLEQVIDDLKETMRNRHILRLQQGNCGMEEGFVWADLLTDLERVSDHCSNIAGTVLDVAGQNLNLHETLRDLRTGSDSYRRLLKQYEDKFNVSQDA